MTLPAHTRQAVLRALRLLADAERAGRSLPARQLGLDLGMSEAAGKERHRLLADLGLVQRVSKAASGPSVQYRLTPAAWDLLGETPPDPQQRRQRRCLKCRTEFVPDGPMFVCAPCKETREWRAGAAGPDGHVHRAAPRQRGAA